MNPELINQLQADASQLTGVEFTDLLGAVNITAGEFSNLGAVTTEAQAQITEALTTAIRTIKPTVTDIELSTELRAVLGGDFGSARSDLARFLVSSSGETVESLKAQFEAARQAGEGVDFLQSRLAPLIESVKLTASSLTNLQSVVNQQVLVSFQNIGNVFLEAQKSFTSLVGEALGGSAQFDRAFNSIGQAIRATFGALEPLVGPGIELLIEGGATIGEVWRTVALALQPIAELLSGVATGINLILQGINPILGGFNDLLEVAVTAISSIIDVTRDWVAEFQIGDRTLGEIAQSFSDNWNEAFLNFRNLILGISQDWQEFLNFLGQISKDVLLGVTQTFLRTFEGIARGLNAIIPENAFGGFFNDLSNSATAAVNTINQEIQATNQAIATSFRELANQGAQVPGFTIGRGSGNEDTSEQDAAAQKEQDRLQRALDAEAKRQEALNRQLQQLEGQEQLENEINQIKLRSAELSAQIANEKDPELRKQLEIQKAELDALGALNARIAAQRELVAQRDAELQRAQQARQELVDNNASQLAIEQADTRILQLKREQEQAQLRLNGLLTNQEVATTNLETTLQRINENGVKGIADQTGDLATAFQDVGRTLSDSISEAVKTGELDVQDLAGNVLGTFTGLLDDVANQVIQAGIGGIFGGAGAGASGGGSGIFGSLLGGLFGGFRANGGPVNPNQAFIVGERGPELFVPPSAGNIVSNSQLTRPGDMPGQSIVINNNVNAIDQRGVQEFFASPAAQQAMTTNATRTVQQQSNKRFNRSTFE